VVRCGLLPCRMKNLLNEIFHGSWQPFRSKAPKQNQRDERTNDQEHQRPGITVRRRRGILRRVCIRLDDDGIVIQNMNFLFHVFGLARQGSPGRRGERIFHKNHPDCDRKPIQNRGQYLSWWCIGERSGVGESRGLLPFGAGLGWREVQPNEKAPALRLGLLLWGSTHRVGGGESTGTSR